MKHIKIKHESIKKFLSKLSDVDFRYLRLQISMANDARNLIKEFSLTKERFCELMDIYDFEYESYLNGGFSYDIEKMALLDAAYCKLSAEKAANEIKDKFTNIGS